MAKQFKDASYHISYANYSHTGKNKMIVTKAMGFVLWILLASSIFLHAFLSRRNPSIIVVEEEQQFIHLRSHEKEDVINRGNVDDAADCYLFEGRWVRDYYRSSYTNMTCKTLPESKNCGKYGKEQDFVNWRWKPNGCELPRFAAKMFLNRVRGKRMAFVGDSVSRNQMESLLCLLSQEESPLSIGKDPEDRFRTWYFRAHEFILMTLWTKFLVVGTERTVNGSATGVYDLHLDKIDPSWTEKLPWINYLIISDGHWFFRKAYLYENDALVGCVYCSGENLTDFGPGLAAQRAFRTALGHVNSCAECQGLLTILRTFSPAHFESGAWNGGGKCNRTRPLRESEAGLGGTYAELRDAQIAELRGMKENGATTGDRRFEILDVTRAMMARADAHPGEHWNNEWMRGYSDCVHWCLPGPIDTWNEMLLEILKKYELTGTTVSFN